MLWYFLALSIQSTTQGPPSFVSNDEVCYGVTRHLSETSSTAVLDGTINFLLIIADRTIHVVDKQTE